MKVTARMKSRSIVVTAIVALSMMMVGCSSPTPTLSAETPQQDQQSAPTPPSNPLAQCVEIVGGDTPIVGPATYVAWFESQEEYDAMVKSLLADGLSPLEGGDGLQVRFEVTPDDLSDFLSPADTLMLNSLTEPFHLITDFENGKCTTTA